MSKRVNDNEPLSEKDLLDGVNPDLPEFDMQTLNIEELEKDHTICEYEQILEETPKAYRIDFGDCQHWVPKACSEIGLHPEDNCQVIAIMDWKYKELGL